MSPVDLFAALEEGVRSTIPVTIACACAGIIIGSVFVSGLGLKFTQSVIDLSGGHLMALLALTAVASIVLGMGLTTTAVYITLAALIIPALEKMHVAPMAAHMFAFYYGVVSTITPPVALAAFAAAAIAGSPPMATAFEASKVGITKFLVPFIFVYNPSIIFVGPLWMTAFLGGHGPGRRLGAVSGYRGLAARPARVRGARRDAGLGHSAALPAAALPRAFRLRRDHRWRRLRRRDLPDAHPLARCPHSSAGRTMKLGKSFSAGRFIGPSGPLSWR